MRRRRNGEQIHDHRFIPSDERMADMPAMIGRPMPIQDPAVRRLSIPVPFDAAPQLRDRIANFALSAVVTIKVLTCGQQALHEKCRLDKVAAVVVLAEVRIYPPRFPIEKVWPYAVKAISAGKKPHDF